MKKHFPLVLFIIFIFLVESCSPKYTPAKYASKTGSASPEQETQITLDDGASVSIPETSLNGDISIKFERNSKKSETLPPLPEGFVQVSDFYNFEVTSGTLSGAVDLTLPVNKEVVPNGDGFFVLAFPVDNEWEIKLVEEKDEKVTTYTNQLGDPLIAWHFANTPPEQNVCDSTISIGVVPDGDKLRVVGRVIGAKQPFFMPKSNMSNINVLLYINGTTGIPDRNKLNTITDKDGAFALTIDPKEHPEIASADRGAINYIYATAECERLYAIKEIVEGSVPFLYHPPTQQQTTTNLPTQPPVTQFQTFTPPQSPTDKIPVPNVIGMTFDDAQKTLEDLGFNTTWINGNSNLELGKIYSQAPVAGTLSVPHRTTVVIYRTTEVVSIPLECAQLNLTPEECANAGTHEYSSSTKITYSDTPTRCGDESNSTYSLTFLFSAENSLQMIYSNEFIVNLKRVDRNSYTGSGITNDGIGKFTYALTFNQNGFINEETMIHIKENRHDCTWVNNNIITK